MQAFTSTSHFTTALILFAVFTNLGLAKAETPLNSNLNHFAYPKHNCKSKPKRPIKPKKLSSENDIQKYNQEISKYNINVVTYNKEIKRYKKCINQYIRNGNHDINIIRQQLNSALKEARTK